jgi:uncharacterized membrane protein
MPIGPVEYVILGFPENNFTGEIAPELADLVDNGLIRIIDLIFVSKDQDGNVIAIEVDEHDGLAGFAEIDGEVGGILGDEDIQHAAEALEPNTSAALIVWEDTWAAPLVQKLRDAGGVLIEGGRIPHDLVETAMADLEPTS